MDIILSQIKEAVLEHRIELPQGRAKHITFNNLDTDYQNRLRKWTE